MKYAKCCTPNVDCDDISSKLYTKHIYVLSIT